MHPADASEQVDAPGAGDALEFWLDELDHRIEHPATVRAAALLLSTPRPSTPERPDPAASGAGTRRLVAIDPLRDRPLLDDDPDAAVLVDVLLTCLGVPPADYTPIPARIERGERFWAHNAARDVLERFLHGDSVYATPECRVRLEGRARYNLAFDLARLSH